MAYFRVAPTMMMDRSDRIQKHSDDCELEDRLGHIFANVLLQCLSHEAIAEPAEDAIGRENNADGDDNVAVSEHEIEWTLRCHHAIKCYVYACLFCKSTLPPARC